MLKKVFARGQIKTVKENGMINGAVGSTGATDRDGEILDPNGWKLQNFKKAPRLLWAHDAWSLPIGKVNNIEVDSKGRLVFDAEFAEKENDFAKKVADLVRGGFLNTFSVGFKPLEFDDETNTFKKMELLEISMVNVPANPEARLSLDYKSFIKDENKLIKDLKGAKNKKVKKTKKKIKSKPKKRYLSEEKRLLLRNAISTLKGVLDETEPEPKKKGSKKVGSRKAKKTNGVLEALRTVDRAIEIAIHKVKKEN